jgi:hypothetical protein
MEPRGASPRIFISYSHDDEAWRDRVVSQLGVIEAVRKAQVLIRKYVPEDVSLVAELIREKHKEAADD